MAIGETNCSTAPAKIGTLAINPATTWPVPNASAKAGKYVSPIPIITLQPEPVADADAQIAASLRGAAGPAASCGSGRPPSPQSTQRNYFTGHGKIARC